MSQNLRYQFWILLSAGIVFFTCLGTAGLWDEDETWYASCAREMMQRGDWVVPMFNGQVFPEKPPLMFWTMMAGFNLFGTNELGARFFSAVFGIATALLTYHLGRKLFNDRVGFWGGLITASSIIFTVSARAATVDAALVFLTTAAVWCFVMVRGEWRGKRGESDSQGSAFKSQDAAQFAICNLQLPIFNHLFFQFALFVAFYIFLGIAVLAKGPIGFLLPMASLGLFLMIKNYRPKSIKDDASPNKRKLFFLRWDFLGVVKRITAAFFVSLWQLRPLTGLITTLAVALPWYMMVAARTRGEWLHTFIFDFCIRPFTQPILGHSGPFWYYLPAVLIGFFPWSVFLGPTCIDLYRRLRAGHPWRDGLLLLSCLFGGWFVFWSICSTKLPHYLLPVYPALSLLTACFLEGWIAEQVQMSRALMRIVWGSTIVVGAGMAIALPIAARILLPGEEWIGAIGLILILGGGLAWHSTAQGKRLAAVRCYGIASIAFLTAAFGLVTMGIDRHQNARPMMAKIHRDSSREATICEYGFHRKSTVYYAGHPIAICDQPAQLQKFLDSARHAYIITLDGCRPEIEKRFPGEFEVFYRQRRFLAFDELVVLKRLGEAKSVCKVAQPDTKQTR